MARRAGRWFVFALILMGRTSFGVDEVHDVRETNTPYTISLNVDLVVLDVSVMDRHGKFVSDLEATDFKIYEDGTLQQVTYFLKNDVPVTAGIAIDNSSSMRGKRGEIVAAALSFVEACNPHDEMFVVHFNENIRFGLGPAQPFTNDPTRLRGAFLRMVTIGQTALYDAVSQAVEHMEHGKHNRKALLLISDGGDNASQLPLKETLDRLQSSHVVVYTIRIYDPSSRDQKPGVLKKLAKISGGQSFFPKDVEQVGPICRQIAVDIRNQYLLAYRSSNPLRNGAFRQVRVTLDTPAAKDMVVRSRNGYFAPRDNGAMGQAAPTSSGIP